MQPRSQRVREWLFDAALPFWLERGVESSGAFVEALTLDGADAGVAFRRTRVACRQIYVFSHAALLGWSAGLESARKGAAWLQKACWRPDNAGFVRRVDRAGQVIDPVIDLYDNAFALFALAWLHKATGDAAIAQAMRQTLTAIEQSLPHSDGAGYFNDETRSGPRQQNPHMHLTEACLAAFETTGDGAYLERATALVALCTQHFFDGVTLAEFFCEDWARAPGEEGRHIEPGHMLEWSWILKEHSRLSGADHRAVIAGLIDFAETRGIDPRSKAVFNVVRDDGHILDGGSRTWPNTERLKAAVAGHEVLALPHAPAMASAATDVLLDRYLAGVPAGGWRDQFDAEGRPIANLMPASTFYHVMLAFAEGLRAPHLMDGA